MLGPHLSFAVISFHCDEPEAQRGIVTLSITTIKSKCAKAGLTLSLPDSSPRGSFYRALANGRPELNKSKQSIFHVAPKTTPPMIGSLTIH